MLQVTAAITRDSEGRVLICRRPEGKNCAGLWEFPGGKLEEGETMEECLIRECEEELSVELSVGDEFSSVVHDYGTFTVEVHFFLCTILSGVPVRKEHEQEAVAWAYPSELFSYRFCPADAEVVSKIVRASF